MAIGVVTEIKKLTGSDITLMRQLLGVYAEAFGDFESYSNDPPSDAYLGHLLAKPTFLTLVALSDGKVVGGLSAYVLEKFEQERSEVYIYDLAVQESFRRHKIATRLIEALKPLARAQKAWVIYVQADKTDVPAIKLYDSLGTQEDVFHYDIEV